MIYDQSFIYYFFSFLLAPITILRTGEYLKKFFDKRFSLLVAATIILHPLTLDIFYGPNFISGLLAFYLFIESLIFLKNDSPKVAIGLAILATTCNFSYCFFPVYFYFLNHKKLNFKFGIILYTLLLSLYYWKNLLLTFHNPFNFFIYYSLNLIYPMSLSSFHYSLFPYGNLQTAFVLFIYLVLLWRHSLNPVASGIWPLLIFPVAGIFVHQWIGPYSFWDELMMYPSNYLCISFAFLVLLALYLPKKVFSFFSIVIILISLFISFHVFPLSKAIEFSIMNLPDDFKYTVGAKRILAWEYLYENKERKGYQLLKALHLENPTDAEISKDVENFKIK